MSGGMHADRAALGAVHRTVPNKRKSLAVTNTAAFNGDFSAFSSADLRGKWIYLTAQTSEITILRGDWTGGNALVAGIGIVVRIGEIVEFYVDPNESPTFSTVSAGASATLWCLYDDEI